MKTKTIPFDAKMAKDIQDGKIEGKIMTRCGDKVRIVCWNSTAKFCGFTQPIIAQSQDQDEDADLYAYFRNGRYIGEEEHPKDLVLEVPDHDAKECNFKPFECVLVRKEGDIWKPRLFDEYVAGDYWAQDGEAYDYCIPYKDNDYLIGTDKEPNEQ